MRTILVLSSTLEQVLVCLLGMCTVYLCSCHAIPRQSDDVADTRFIGDLKLRDDIAWKGPFIARKRPVPLKYFNEKLQAAQTYYDIVRIFYSESLSNQTIDEILTQDSSLMDPGYRGIARPRIGGLSDMRAFRGNQLSLEGISHEPSLDTALMADQCKDCTYSPKRQEKSMPVLRHSVGRKRKRKGKRKGRDRSRNKGRKRGRRRKNRKAADSVTQEPSAKRTNSATFSLSEIAKAYDHFKEMGVKTKCKDPVPTVVHIRDLNTPANRIYKPECTIVYECRRNAGCCNATSECVTKKNHTITRLFLAFEFDGDKVKQVNKVQKFTFVNHTECECRPLKMLPKCLECPFPFSLRRENKTDCSCDCFDRDHTCLRIKKGRNPLREQDLSCIKDKLCHRPKCQHGVFDEESIKSGYCPRQKKNKKSKNFRIHGVE